MSTFYDDIFEKEICLIRHPKTLAGQMFCYGASDVDVADDVLAETIERVAGKLADFSPEECFSSPLIRCQKLAKGLFPNHKITLIDSIREINFGCWEGVAWQEIPVEAQKRWGNDVLNFKEHKGENFKDLQQRVVPFWEELLESKASKIAVVAHSGVIVALLSYLFEADPSKVFMLDITFGSVVRIKIKGGCYFKIQIDT